MPVIDVVIPGSVDPQDSSTPCNWTVDTLCVADWASVPPNVQTAASEWAVQILWALTGRQYGACSVTLRPCGPRCMGPNGYLAFPVNSGGFTGATGPWMIPWIDAGVWRNCGCTGGCSCSAPCEIAIPGPVSVIDEVRVDGIVLDPSAYRLDSLRGIPVLVRIDGECWPDCQDMAADIDEPGAFSVTYQRGRVVPRSGQLAAGELAGEFAKACQGQDCALPQQLASMTRNGIEVQVMDPNTLLESGLTGIANVDLWIRAVNPARKAMRSRVLSADVPAQRYMT